MTRTGKRITITKGVYKDRSGYEVRVVVGGTPYSKRMPADSTLDELKRARAHLEAKGRTDTPKAERGTLKADAAKYLKLQTHLASHRIKRAHLNAWIAVLGETVRRHRVTAADVQRARLLWLKTRNPKTINHRVNTLRHLYRTLDGKKAETPCDDLDPLPVERTPIQRVSDATILLVDANLQRREADPAIPLWTAKTRARFRVLVTTGRRPSEVMRAKPTDVDLEQRVWVVRDGKGGWSPGLYLNDDMLAAWQLFVDAKAWGKYNTSSFGRAIREAGWPADVRPYNARHTTWIMATERGADMADVQTGAGHKSLATTRLNYTGIRQSRMQRLSEMLDGRFNQFPVVPISGTEKPAPKD